MHDVGRRRQAVITDACDVRRDHLLIGSPANDRQMTFRSLESSPMFILVYHILHDDLAYKRTYEDEDAMLYNDDYGGGTSL
jgi:hypothetical protein